MAIEQLAELLADGASWRTASPSMLALAAIASLALQGFVMGRPAGWRQAAASAVKMPAVPFGSLAVTAPAMLALAQVCGVSMEAGDVLRLLLATVALHAVLSASFAPIAWFFSLGSGYDFMKVLHSAILGACGIVAAARLMSAVRGSGADNGVGLFLAWCIVWGFAGCQMAWTLRPLLGSPDMPFQFLRARERGMNFVGALWQSIARLGGGR